MNYRVINVNGVKIKVDKTGKSFINAESDRRYTIYKNKKRGNRETINVGNRMVYTSVIIAKAFPEICGEWFEGCEVHHIDEDKSNNTPENLICLSRDEHLSIHTPDFVQKMVERNSKPVHQYTLDGEYIQSFSSSIEASDYLFPNDTTKWHRSSIRNNLCGLSKSAFGFIWTNSTEPSLFIEPIEEPKYQTKRISNGEKTFNSVKEAAEYYGVGPTAICNCLKGRNDTSCGFKWYYVD